MAKPKARHTKNGKKSIKPKQPKKTQEHPDQSFLHLLPEVRRNDVYKLLLTSLIPIHVPRQSIEGEFEKPTEDNQLSLTKGEPVTQRIKRKTLFVDILATSKRIHFEASPIFYGCNIFHFDCFPLADHYDADVVDIGDRLHHHYHNPKDYRYGQYLNMTTTNTDDPFLGIAYYCGVPDAFPPFFPMCRLHLLKKIRLTVSMTECTADWVTCRDINDMTTQVRLPRPSECESALQRNQIMKTADLIRCFEGMELEMFELHLKSVPPTSFSPARYQSSSSTWQLLQALLSLSVKRHFSVLFIGDVRTSRDIVNDLEQVFMGKGTQSILIQRQSLGGRILTRYYQD